MRPSTSTGVEGPARDVLPAIIEQRAHPSPFAACNKDVADVQRAALDEHGCNRTAPALEFGLEHDPLGGAIRVGPEIEQLGLQQNRLLELVEVGLFERRDLDVEHLAAELLDDQLVLQQLLPHALGLRIRLVHLVDGDDDRHLRRLGVTDRFDSLFHDAVIGGYDEHHDSVTLAPRARIAVNA